MITLQVGVSRDVPLDGMLRETLCYIHDFLPMSVFLERKLDSVHVFIVASVYPSAKGSARLGI